jgi:hypothetical protein
MDWTGLGGIGGRTVTHSTRSPVLSQRPQLKHSPFKPMQRTTRMHSERAGLEDRWSPKAPVRVAN